MQLIINETIVRVTEQTKTEFLKYYEPLHNQFCKYCRAISGNPDDGDDLIQDTVLNVMEKFENIRDLSLFKSYLYSVASNLHKMKLRRNKFRASFNEAEMNQIIDFGQNPEYLTEFKIIYEKILLLPEKTAEAIVLFHISDISIEEIQKVQGDSISAVKSRLQRGREKLISLLETKKQVDLAIMLLTL